MGEKIAQVEVFVYREAGDDFEFLIMKRTEERGGFWQPVTGGVEEGEEIIDAALREVREETGFGDVGLTEKVHEFFLDTDCLSCPEYVFGAKVSSDNEVALDKNIYLEHDEFRWCSFDEAMGLLLWEDNKDGLRRLYSLLKG